MKNDMSILHETELSNSKSEILSDSYHVLLSTEFNCSEEATKENIAHVNSAVESETVFSVAFITEPQEINVLDPMVNQCYLSLKTTRKASEGLNLLTPS